MELREALALSKVTFHLDICTEKESSVEVRACNIVRKPIEKIIVRYDGIPKSFVDVFEPVKIQLLSREKKPSEVTLWLP